MLTAEPGAGKSTGLPLALLLGKTIEGKIVLLEPRRLAARMVAERLASHLGERVGQRVGLRMRLDTRVSKHTQLEVVTEGVLTRMLQDDPTLDGIGLVVFDEFHERSLQADLGFALCIEVQRALREDLRLLLMSATLDVDQIGESLADIGQFHCAVRQHPVETIFLGESRDPLPQRVAMAVMMSLDAHQGDILVFLPGVAEISRTARLLASMIKNPEIKVLRLHSSVSAGDQAQATSPADSACRRVILSTSLAETSITIDGVRVVVDSGLERRGRMDTGTGALLLETVTASQASAKQRAGRAGRTAAGVCYRLWSDEGHVRRPSHWQPEILRADLAPLLMEVGRWGAHDPVQLPWLDRPPTASLLRAEKLLNRLGLWRKGQLMPDGRLAANMPVHPRVARLLIWAAERGAQNMACRMAVWLEEQQRGHSIDLDACLNAPLNSYLQRRVAQLTAQLRQIKSIPDGDLVCPPACVVLAQAYPDWIAQRRHAQPGSFVLACGAGVTMDQEEALAHCRWLVVAKLGGAENKPRIYKAIELDIDALKLHSPELFSTVEHLDWDAKASRVVAESRTLIGKLLVESQPLRQLSDSDRAKAMLSGIRKIGLDCLPWTEECREWQARVVRMQAFLSEPEKHAWPAADDRALVEQLESWLLPFIYDASSLKALQQIDLLNVLNAMLDYQQQCKLDEWLPRRYQVPSGSSIRLRYVPPGNPVLSVRLQEMLGCTQNPSVAKGRITLKVELLSPAMRPVQVTEDLANFWTNSYPQVKKEMAGRYPKHFWPDDPLSAQATARAKPRK